MYQLGSFQKILLRINDAYDLSASTKNVKSDQNLLSVCGQAVFYTFSHFLPSVLLLTTKEFEYKYVEMNLNW